MQFENKILFPQRLSNDKYCEILQKYMGLNLTTQYLTIDGTAINHVENDMESYKIDPLYGSLVIVKTSSKTIRSFKDIEGNAITFIKSGQTKEIKNTFEKKCLSSTSKAINGKNIYIWEFSHLENKDFILRHFSDEACNSGNKRKEDVEIKVEPIETNNAIIDVQVNNENNQNNENKTIDSAENIIIKKEKFYNPPHLPKKPPTTDHCYKNNSPSTSPFTSCSSLVFESFNSKSSSSPLPCPSTPPINNHSPFNSSPSLSPTNHNNNSTNNNVNKGHGPVSPPTLSNNLQTTVGKDLISNNYSSGTCLDRKQINLSNSIDSLSYQTSNYHSPKSNNMHIAILKRSQQGLPYSNPNSSNNSLNNSPYNSSTSLKNFTDLNLCSSPITNSYLSNDNFLVQSPPALSISGPSSYTSSPPPPPPSNNNINQTVVSSPSSLSNSNNFISNTVATPTNNHLITPSPQIDNCLLPYYPLLPTPTPINNNNINLVIASSPLPITNSNNFNINNNNCTINNYLPQQQQQQQPTIINNNNVGYMNQSIDISLQNINNYIKTNFNTTSSDVSLVLLSNSTNINNHTATHTNNGNVLFY